MPGTAEYNATHPLGMGTTGVGGTAQNIGAASTLPSSSSSSAAGYTAGVPPTGGVQQTTTRITETQYGQGGTL